MNLATHEAKYRRRDILLLLDGDSDQLMNESLLRARLEAEYGYRVSAAVLRDDLRWLAELGLLKIIGSSELQIAQLLERGQDFAQRREVIPDLARVDPPRG